MPVSYSGHLGNEAGNGWNFMQGYNWIRGYDPSRPIQYERALSDWNTDLIVPQYPDPEWMVRYSKSNPDRPLIMSEYAHIMGNSLGNFQDYWDVIESHPFLQGGFIWEWVDQAIYFEKNGKKIFGYSGDWGKPLNDDHNFCVKGVVTADRKITPMYEEAKKVHQFIKTKAVDAKSGIIEVFNSYFFRDLSNYYMTWDVTENGVVVANGKINELTVEPQKAKRYTLVIPSQLAKDKEVMLNVRYRAKTDEIGVPKEMIMAYDQFKLNDVNYSTVVKSINGGLNYTESDNAISIKGAGVVLTFDKKLGEISLYSFNGKTILEHGARPDFWRPLTDNDYGAGYNRKNKVWRDPGLKVISFHLSKLDNGNIVVDFEKSLLNDDAIYKAEVCS